MSGVGGRNLLASPALVPHLGFPTTSFGEQNDASHRHRDHPRRNLAGRLLCLEDGMSLSESKLVDNNCTGNAFFVNKSWCADTLHASMGPYTGK